MDQAHNLASESPTPRPVQLMKTFRSTLVDADPEHCIIFPIEPSFAPPSLTLSRNLPGEDQQLVLLPLQLLQPTQPALAAANQDERSQTPHMKYFDVWVPSYDSINSLWIQHGNVVVLRLGSVTMFTPLLHFSMFSISMKVIPTLMSEFSTGAATNDNQPLPFNP